MQDFLSGLVIAFMSLLTLWVAAYLLGFIVEFTARLIS